MGAFTKAEVVQLRRRQLLEMTLISDNGALEWLLIKPTDDSL